MLRLSMLILWPAFLVAVAAEGLFFSLFDPRDMTLLNSPTDLSPATVYALGFFFFWAFCSLASMLTFYLQNVPRNPQPPF